MTSIVDMLTGGNEYTQEREEAEKPKAHENIDNLISSNKLSPEITEVIQAAIFGGIAGKGGSFKGLTKLIKGKGGVESLKLKNIYDDANTPAGKAILDKIIKSNDANLHTMSTSAKGKAFLNKFIKDGGKGNPFSQRKDGTYFMPPRNLDLKKYTLSPTGTIVKLPKKVSSNNKKVSSANNSDNGINIGALITALTTGGVGGLAGFTANKANEEYDLSNKLARILMPDPEMETKGQHDEDMDMLVKLMGPEAKLKYLKKTGQGYPADEEMFLRAEPQDTNEILLQLLREQSQ